MALQQKIVRKLVLSLIGKHLSPNTRDGLIFDLLRWQIREETRGLKPIKAKHDKLNLGCGKKKPAGWVNIDLLEADINWDLGCGQLPFEDESFSLVVTEHFVEHIDLETQLLPLLKDLYRCCKPGAKVLVSCPSLEMLSKSYLETMGQSLIDGRKRNGYHDLPPVMQKYPKMPKQQIVNETIFQKSEHKNLYDEELLSFVLETAGFKKCEPVDDARYAELTGGFEKRDDAFEAVVLVCEK